jgi:hypothetical protein
MLRILTSVFALTSLALVSFTASAQGVCSERAKFVDQLAVNYAENTVGLGLVNNGNVLEILVSKNGTWTILVTKPSGISCVVATGEAWEKIPRKLASEPAA